MANPQPTDAHLRIAHSITEAIMLRDFTKRQRNILDLILRLSWGCGKKEAVIPRQCDFEVVGVGKSHIGSELRWLVASKIIDIAGDEYSFNKDFDQWQVSRVKPYMPEKVTELVTLNLSRLPKQEPTSYRNSNKAVTETVTSPDTKSATSKERVKEIPKESGTGTGVFTEEKSYQNGNLTTNIFTLYESNIGMLTPMIGDQLKDAETQYPADWITEAFQEAVSHNKRNWKYVEAILKRWKQDGRGNGKSGRIPADGKYHTMEEIIGHVEPEEESEVQG